MGDTAKLDGASGGAETVKETQGRDAGQKEKTQGRDAGQKEETQGRDAGQKEETQGRDAGQKKETQGRDAGQKEETQGRDAGQKEETQGRDAGQKKETQGRDAGQKEETQGRDAGQKEETQGGDAGQKKETQGRDAGQKEETQGGDAGQKEETQGRDAGQKEETQGGDAEVQSGGLIATVKQTLAAILLGQGLICLGINFGMHSVTLIQVPADPDRFLTDDQLNWTIAATVLGGMLGCALAVPVAPLLGARRLLLVAMPMHVLGALAAGLGHSFVWVLLGRVLMFVALQFSEGTVRGYVSEIVPPTRRALYATFMNTFVYFGQVAALVLGQYMDWQTLFVVAGCTPPVICLCGVLFLPDSAKWLLAHGHCPEEARRGILFYHPHADAAAEVAAIQDSLAHTHDGTPAWRLMGRRETLRPLLLAAMQMVLFVWCGGQTLVLITSVVLDPADLPLDSYQRAMVIPALAVLLCAPSFPVIERFGRLKLLRAAGAVMAAGCTIVAVFYFLAAEQRTHLGWMVMLGAAVVVVPYFCIVGPISFGYANELLPNKTRALGANMVLMSINFSTFVLLKVYPTLQANIGLGGLFVLHAAVSLLQVVFAIVCLPETQGQTLEQIQHMFQRVRNVAELPIHVQEAGTCASQGEGEVAAEKQATGAAVGAIN